MYIYIPEQIVTRPDLTLGEKFVAGVIISLSKKNGFCYATNKHIGELVFLSPKSVSRTITRLVNSGIFEATVARVQDSKGRWKTERTLTNRIPNLGTILPNAALPLPTNEAYKVKEGKLKDINKERPIVNNSADLLLEWWNRKFGKKFKSIDQSGFAYWNKKYSINEMKVAIGSHQKHDFWHNKLNPQMLFKKQNTRGEEMDVIGQLLNFETSDPQVLRYRKALEGAKNE